jgi:hypothetical protein
MSSLNWFKPSDSKHAAWLNQYLANNYPEINRDLRNKLLTGKSYCSHFKGSIKIYWKDENLRKVNLAKLRNAWDKAKSRQDKNLKSLSIELNTETKKAFRDLAIFHKKTHEELLTNLIEYFNLQTGKTDFFETAEKRYDKAYEIESKTNEIIELKKRLSDKDKEIGLLKAKLSNKQELNSELELPNKSEQSKTSMQELINKQFEEIAHELDMPPPYKGPK